MEQIADKKPSGTSLACGYLQLIGTHTVLYELANRVRIGLPGDIGMLEVRLHRICDTLEPFEECEITSARKGEVNPTAGTSGGVEWNPPSHVRNLGSVLDTRTWGQYVTEKRKLGRSYRMRVNKSRYDEFAVLQNRHVEGCPRLVAILGLESSYLLLNCARQVLGRDFIEIGRAHV